ncbi:MAG: HAD hydrolase family protein [Staphylococcus epidermidis]|nr:HAD hydrolase family protein [Staphylococcus epidermidis]
MNFIFDIDGTICFDGCSIDPSIKQRLFKLRQANHNVMFASARPIRDLLPVIPEFADDTLIGGNGSIISKNGQIEIVSVINEHDISLIKKLIKKYQLSYIIDDKFNYASNLDTNNELYQRIDPDGKAQSLDMDEIRNPIKAILLNIDKKNFDMIAHQLVSQSHGIELIRHYSGDYIAFGNDHNDVHMLEHASQGYFVTNQFIEHTLFFKNQNITVIDDTIHAICEVLDKYL